MIPPPTPSNPMPGVSDKRRFWAFLSYSHKDSPWARKVHKGIESYRLPRRLVGKPSLFGWPVPRRIFPVFRDEDELPTSANLGENLTEALEDSHTLVVICSPDSAHSKWVNEEIRHYKSMGRASRVMALIIAGEPNASDYPDLGRPECFPLALRRRVNEAGEITDQPVEPLAADVRDAGTPWRQARLKLIAGIVGLPYDELRQRERERARAKAVLWAVCGLFLIAAFAGYRHSLKHEHRQEQIAALMNSAGLHIGERHLLHGGVDLIKAAALGQSPQAMAAPLRQVARTLVPLVDVMTSAAKSIETLAFSPDGALLGVAGSDGRVSIWQLAPEGALLAHRLKLGNRSASQLVFHPQGDRVAVALWDGTVRVWQFNTAAPPVVCSGHYPKVRLNAVDIHAGGEWMVSGGDDTFAKVWDTKTWTLSGEPLAEHNDWVKSIRFSPDGSLVVTAGLDGSLKVYAFPSRSLVLDLMVKDGLNRAVIAADDETVIAGGRQGNIWIINLKEKRVLHVIDHAHASRINDIALHPDKASFMTASDDGYVRRWRIKDFEMISSIEDHGPLTPNPLVSTVKILAVACSSDGALVATAGDKGVIKVWKVDQKPDTTPEHILDALQHRVQNAFQKDEE